MYTWTYLLHTHCIVSTPPDSSSSPPTHKVGRYSADVELQEEARLCPRVQTPDFWLLVAYQTPAAVVVIKRKRKRLPIWDSVMLFLLLVHRCFYPEWCNYVVTQMTSWTTKYLYIGTFMVCMFVVLLYWLHNSLSACVYYRTIYHQYRADCSGSNVLPGRDCPLCWHSLRHVCLWVLRAIWGWKGKTQVVNLIMNLVSDSYVMVLLHSKSMITRSDIQPYLCYLHLPLPGLDSFGKLM